MRLARFVPRKHKAGSPDRVRHLLNLSQSCPMPMRNTVWDEIQHALSMSSWEICCSHTACAASFEWGPFKFHWRVIGPASKTCRFLGTMAAAAAASKLHLFTRTSSICSLLAASMRLIKLTKSSGAAADEEGSLRDYRSKVLPWRRESRNLASTFSSFPSELHMSRWSGSIDA